MLKAVRQRAEATLNSLIIASKTHATSAGMSPASLLDAAASHVSATVMEIGKTVPIRRASRAQLDNFNSAASSPSLSSSLASPNTATLNGGFSPSSLRSVDEVKPLHQKASNGAGAALRSTDVCVARIEIK